MDQFKACICDHNYKALVLSGKFSAEEMAAAWECLFYEYCDLTDAQETKYRIRLISYIKNNKRKIALAEGWVKIISVFFIPQFALALQTIGFEFALDPSDEKQFAADLFRIKAEIASMKLKLRIKEVELEVIMEKKPAAHSFDKKYFSTIFFRINNYAKREAVNGLTIVANYCAALKDYLSYVELTKQNLRSHGI
jgi:hypothetical protein